VIGIGDTIVGVSLCGTFVQNGWLGGVWSIRGLRGGLGAGRNRWRRREQREQGGDRN
jgi:hypothetical protein